MQNPELLQGVGDRIVGGHTEEADSTINDVFDGVLLDHMTSSNDKNGAGSDWQKADNLGFVELFSKINIVKHAALYFPDFINVKTQQNY
ncbi:hypothetical protein NX059_010214 [Plenodomus lindquistii]|nr:hypothetical protein NX059_010214 [Plenodomus lindquistii]